MTKPLFQLGQIVVTIGIERSVAPGAALGALARHARGDWGEVCDDDAAENELSLKEGFRLLSVYEYENQPKFWIITEADRSVTTILLPEEY